MAYTSFTAPANMDFQMGSTEKKMDMTLDDIIKLTKKNPVKKPRVPIRMNRNKNQNNVAAKAALQRSVAARASAIRQGKIAEARARNGTASFPATQAAGRRAFTAPVASRSKQWVRTSEVQRNQIGIRRGGPGFKKGPTSAGVAGNMRISVINDSSKNVRRPVPPFWRRNANVGITRQVEQATSWGGNNNSMEVDYVDPVPQKPRTLDSRFASLKERRNGTQQVVTFNATEQNRRRNVVTNGAGRRRPTA
eukprot:TRINITY_DN206_c0_g1_i3.p1 TRINITY_DN206_c0_g1~~TRINITY_DN206_c0_g1_i3.p1  ORF type:complete len:250 (-),score=50.70 TRINITY_DN206_c0_g1_i3:757-1506(-)